MALQKRNNFLCYTFPNSLILKTWMILFQQNSMHPEFMAMIVTQSSALAKGLNHQSVPHLKRDKTVPRRNSAIAVLNSIYFPLTPG